MEKLVLVLLMFSSIGLGKLLGGKETVSNPNESAEIQRIARFATEQINARNNNSAYAMMCTNIVSAAKQIVAGVNYYLTIELSPTVCKQNTGGGRIDVENCGLLEGPQAESMASTCTVQVYEKSWQHIIQLVNFECQSTSK